MYYSFSAYCTNQSILNWNCHFCKGDTEGFKPKVTSFDSKTDTFAFVGVHHDRKEGKFYNLKGIIF